MTPILPGSDVLIVSMRSTVSATENIDSDASSVALVAENAKYCPEKPPHPEAKHGQSRKDFLSKMNIALKEAVETEYWIRLMQNTDYLTAKQAESVLHDCDEIIRILHAIVKTTKSDIEN